jgi:hypothetical protein
VIKPAAKPVADKAPAPNGKGHSKAGSAAKRAPATGKPTTSGKGSAPGKTAGKGSGPSKPANAATAPTAPTTNL